MTLNVQMDLSVLPSMGADGGQPTHSRLSVVILNAGRAREDVNMTTNVMDLLYVVMGVVSLGQLRSVALRGKLGSFYFH